MKPDHDKQEPCEAEFVTLVKRPVRPPLPCLKVNRLAGYHQQIPRNGLSNGYRKGWMG